MTVSLPGAQTKEDRSWVLPAVMVLVALFSSFIATFAWSPILSVMQKDWGVSLSQMGTYMGVAGIMSILLSAIYGEVTNKIGVKWAMLLALGAATVGLVVIAMAPSYGVGIVGRVISSAGYVVAMVPGMAALGLVAPPKVVGTLMSLITVMAALASVLGQQLIGARIGPALGWQAAHWATAAVCAVGTVLFALLFRAKPAAAPAPATADASAVNDTAAEAPAPSPYKSINIWLLALAYGLIGFGAYAVYFFMPLSLPKQFGMDAQGVATVVSTGSLVAIPFVVLAGVLSDRLGNRKLVVLGFVIASLLISFGFLSQAVGVFSITAILHAAIGGGAPCAAINSAVPQLHPYKNVASVFGLLMTFSGAMQYIVPQLLGVLADATGGFTVGWIVTIVGIAVGLVCILLAKFE